jgi:hypothetical protein
MAGTTAAIRARHRFWAAALDCLTMRRHSSGCAVSGFLILEGNPRSGGRPNAATQKWAICAH